MEIYFRGEGFGDYYFDATAHTRVEESVLHAQHATEGVEALFDFSQTVIRGAASPWNSSPSRAKLSCWGLTVMANQDAVHTEAGITAGFGHSSRTASPIGLVDFDCRCGDTTVRLRRDVNALSYLRLLLTRVFGQ